MAHIPLDAKWYLAELIVEITVQGDHRNVVHKNLTLVRANSPEEAYKEAVALGKGSETSYKNPNGKLVILKFRGLASLDVICEELDHGAELLYEEFISVSDDQIKKWIIPKGELNVFRPQETAKDPDYSSGDILREAASLLKDSSG